jgi:hypothetical protein
MAKLAVARTLPESVRIDLLKVTSKCDEAMGCVV